MEPEHWFDTDPQYGHDDYVIEQIRRYWKAEPFRPFEIRMSDGRAYKILSPDMVWVTPNNAVFVWLAEENASDRLHVLHIASVSGVKAPA